MGSGLGSEVVRLAVAVCVVDVHAVRSIRPRVAGHHQVTWSWGQLGLGSGLRLGSLTRTPI